MEDLEEKLQLIDELNHILSSSILKGSHEEISGSSGDGHSFDDTPIYITVEDYGFEYSFQERRKARKKLKKEVKILGQFIEKYEKDLDPEEINKARRAIRVEKARRRGILKGRAKVIGGLVLCGVLIFSAKSCLDENARKATNHAIYHAVRNYEQSKQTLEASKEEKLDKEYSERYLKPYRDYVKSDEEDIKKFVEKGKIDKSHEYYNKLEGYFGDRDWWKKSFSDEK